MLSFTPKKIDQIHIDLILTDIYTPMRAQSIYTVQLYHVKRTSHISDQRQATSCGQMITWRNPMKEFFVRPHHTQIMQSQSRLGQTCQRLLEDSRGKGAHVIKCIHVCGLQHGTFNIFLLAIKSFQESPPNCVKHSL